MSAPILWRIAMFQSISTAPPTQGILSNKQAACRLKISRLSTLVATVPTMFGGMPFCLPAVPKCCNVVLTQGFPAFQAIARTRLVASSRSRQPAPSLQRCTRSRQHDRGHFVVECVHSGKEMREEVTRRPIASVISLAAVVAFPPHRFDCKGDTLWRLRMFP